MLEFAEQRQYQQQQAIAAEHARLKTQVVPTLPDEFGGVKVISQDDEFAGVVLETIRQNDLALQEREEDYSLADVAKPVEQRLRRMYDILHKAYGPKAEAPKLRRETLNPVFPSVE